MSNESEGRAAAAAFRRKHKLGTGPIDDIVSLMDLVDVDVVYVDAGDSEHGLTARDTRTATTVFVVNSKLSSVRFRSTLAHELGHLIFADDLNASVNHEYTSASETRAHAFARNLLLPVEAVKAASQEHSEFDSEELLNWCVRRFGTSPKIAAYQVRNAQLIDAATCHQFEDITTGTLARKYGWSDVNEERDAGVQATRKPRRLQELATRAYLAGAIPAGELAAIIGKTVDEIRDMLPAPIPAPPATPYEYEDFGDDDLSDLP